MPPETLSELELQEAWAALSVEERRDGFLLLPYAEAEELFSKLDTRDQADLLLALSERHQRLWMRWLPPDDAVDVLQAVPPEKREGLFALLDGPTQKEVSALLAYAEDDAGGLMSTRYVRLRPDMSIDAALTYVRRQTGERAESIYYGYVLNGEQRLLGVASLRQLFRAAPDKQVRDIMETEVVTVTETMDQEEVSHVIAQHDLMAVPVVDAEGRMKGIVTVDDIVDVVREEATEDMHKMGAAEVLDAPYLQVSLLELLRKRVGWLALLVLLGFLTVHVMRHFQAQLDQAVIVALFVPLIISTGGNSGSQAATLVVRAMALGELEAGDWWRVMRRELTVGLSIGSVLGVLGAGVSLAWQELLGADEYPYLVAATVGCSIVAIAMWGMVAGSMLPFVLRLVRLDPASASAPLVATLVDSSGLVIYLTIASLVLRGTLL